MEPQKLDKPPLPQGGLVDLFWYLTLLFLEGIFTHRGRTRRSSYGDHDTGAHADAMEHRVPITVLQYNKALSLGLRSSPPPMKYAGK